jgi:hypothetical protein
MKTRTAAASCRQVLVLFALAFATAGCSTLHYRDVQTQFESAVRSDNERASMPFTERLGQYGGVASVLTPAYIENLDPRIRPNAWTLRSVSQWRIGDFTNAVASSENGLAAIQDLKSQAPLVEESRDSVILTMVPGLVEDSRARRRFEERGDADVAEHAAEYSNRFRTALRALAEARTKNGTATPPDVTQYWAYHTWRVLQNWEFTLGRLPIAGQGDARRAADELVARALGEANLAQATSLPKAIEAVEALIPADHPYRKLIEMERLR